MCPFLPRRITGVSNYRRNENGRKCLALGTRHSPLFAKDKRAITPIIIAFVFHSSNSGWTSWEVTLIVSLHWPEIFRNSIFLFNFPSNWSLLFHSSYTYCLSLLYLFSLIAISPSFQFYLFSEFHLPLSLYSVLSQNHPFLDSFPLAYFCVLISLRIR